MTHASLFFKKQNFLRAKFFFGRFLDYDNGAMLTLFSVSFVVILNSKIHLIWICSGLFMMNCSSLHFIFRIMR